MPVYEFKCKDCGELFEELRKMGDFKGAKCPKCGSMETEKVFSLFSGGVNEPSCGTCKPSPGG